MEESLKENLKVLLKENTKRVDFEFSETLLSKKNMTTIFY